MGLIAGFLIGFFIYSLVFVFFTTSSTIFLLIILTVCSVLGIYMHDENYEGLASIIIGAYMIIRGLSFLFGGFPNEAEIILTQISDGNL